MSVEFVSYDGTYPNLCSGTLVVKIDGDEVSFGWNGCDYPPFWISGGSVSFTKDWDEVVSQGEWEISDSNDFPPNIKAALPDLIRLMNEHVPHGCCGGCV